MTSGLFNLGIENVNLTFSLKANGSDLQTIQFPLLTDDRGEFDQFIPIQVDLPNDENVVHRLELFTEGASNGNASSYLVPSKGISVIADIDDVLRVTRIFVPEDGLRNSFAKPFVQWMNMPAVFQKWAEKVPAIHYHYLTTTPEQFTRPYMSFLFNTYPAGSFEDRPLNLTTFDQIFNVRLVNLRRFFQTFPTRKIVLLGDTSNRDVVKGYAQMGTEFPGQLACILLRNTTATDADDKFPYDTSPYKDLPNNTYFFFTVPDDIMNLNFANGDCVNSSVQQNVSFDMQGLPLSGGAAPTILPIVSAFTISIFTLVGLIL